MSGSTIASNIMASPASSIVSIIPTATSNIDTTNTTANITLEPSINNITNSSTPTADSNYFLQSMTAQLLATLFVWSAILITCHHIYMHLRFSTMPSEQRYIVRILFIVPLFGFTSWLSLLYVKHGSYVYFDAVKDWYEAFVIYNFMSLCYEYLGGEGNIMSELRGKPIKTNWYYGTCCLSNRSYTIEFLRFCKQATLQFCFVKPLMSIMTLYLLRKGSYTDGDWSLNNSYFYITMIYNISVSLALYALYLFYQATKGLLAPYEPVWKFLTVKSIIFLSFWQGCLFALLQKFGYLTPLSPDLSQGVTAAGYQNFFISVEMFFAAIAFRYAFPFEIYCYSTDRHSSVTMQSISNSLKETVNPRDIMTDAIHNFHPQYQQYIQYNSGDTSSNMRSKKDSIDEEDNLQDTQYMTKTYDDNQNEHRMVELDPPGDDDEKPTSTSAKSKVESPSKASTTANNLIRLAEDESVSSSSKPDEELKHRRVSASTRNGDLLDEIDLMSPTRAFPTNSNPFIGTPPQARAQAGRPSAPPPSTSSQTGADSSQVLLDFGDPTKDKFEFKFD